jgi:hypothetical protein
MSHARMAVMGAAKIQAAISSTAGAGVSGTGSLSVAYPSGITAGMLLILAYGGKDSSSGTTPPAPSGFTQGVTLNSTLYDLTMWYKVATGSESGTVSVSGVNDTAQIARMFRTTAVASGIEATGSSFSTSSASTFSNVSVTTTANLECAVQLEFALNGVAETVANSTGESGGDYTQPVAVYSPGNNIAIQSAAMATAGTISGGTAVIGASVANRGVLSFAIKP